MVNKKLVQSDHLFENSGFKSNNALFVTGPVSMFCLLELVAVAPDLLASRFISQLNWIKVCIQAV